MTQWLVFGTIAGATVAWAVAEVWRLSSASSAFTVPRVFWTVGAVLMVIHSAAAFGIVHSWSHDAAVAATAKQTAAVTGLAWGGGIFFNYAFLATWMGDALWWWVSPRSYERRPRIISAVVRGFLWFMFLNGAIVFADGGMRALGILAVGAVSIAWLTKFFRQTVPAR